MRVVIDGAAGSGKTTFLSCNYLNKIRKECSKKTINIASLGYTVFSEMMQGAINEAAESKIIPPSSSDEWNQLLHIIFKRGKKQFDDANPANICWYDRGLPFIKAFANINNVELSEEICKKIKDNKYDYAFIFRPIEEFDLSMPNNGKFGPMSLEDRYNEFRAILDAYRQFGYTVYEVPVFSNNLEENFQRRFSFIKEIVPYLNKK